VTNWAYYSASELGILLGIELECKLGWNWQSVWCCTRSWLSSGLGKALGQYWVRYLAPGRFHMGDGLGTRLGETLGWTGPELEFNETCGGSLLDHALARIWKLKWTDTGPVTWYQTGF
jgi:hypothetical protein